MEATGIYWKPVWHLLEEHFALVLTNAQHIRNVPGRKTDVIDAAWIADLLAHGLIRSSFVPPAPIQELRDLTRTRKQLAREVSQHTLRLQKTLEDANLRLDSVLSSVSPAPARARPGSKPRSSPPPGPPRASRTGTCKPSSCACESGAAPRKPSSPLPPPCSPLSGTCSRTTSTTKTSVPITSASRSLQGHPPARQTPQRPRLQRRPHTSSRLIYMQNRRP